MKQRMIGSLLPVTVFAALASLAGAEPATPKVFNIKSYGAIGDGITLETKAIQKTIDACHAAGGGTVRIPTGDFVSGTVQLKSNITLSFDYGASLLGSQNQKHYPIDQLRPAREGNSECFLYAEDANNIRLTSQKLAPS